MEYLVLSFSSANIRVNPYTLFILFPSSWERTLSPVVEVQFLSHHSKWLCSRHFQTRLCCLADCERAVLGRWRSNSFLSGSPFSLDYLPFVHLETVTASISAEAACKVFECLNLWTQPAVKMQIRVPCWNFPHRYEHRDIRQMYREESKLKVHIPMINSPSLTRCCV